MTLRYLRFAVAVASGLILMPASALAESYTNLLKQGYKTGKMTRSRAGNLGWVVSNGDKQFFCLLDVGVVMNNADLKAGRPMPQQVGNCGPHRR